MEVEAGRLSFPLSTNGSILYGERSRSRAEFWGETEMEWRVYQGSVNRRDLMIGICRIEIKKIGLGIPADSKAELD